MYLESSYQDLYQSAVAAFPNTRRRQHVVAPIQINSIIATPFLGLNTLLFRAEALNAGRTYKTTILFKDVNYVDGPGVTIRDEVGKRYFIEQLTQDTQDILLRCSCPDFYWRFCHFDHLDRSLYGRNRANYAGQGLWEANPQQLPGMCKHLMATMQELQLIGIVL